MGPPHIFVEFYFQKLHQVLIMNIKDQSPVNGGKGKGTILKYPLSILLSWTQPYP